MADQKYQILARKYRPQGFDEVLGQAPVSVTLKNALSSGRQAQAYLFTGPRGVGKTTMARILAKALNCVKGPTPQPCGKCDPCREVAASSSLDVLEMDAASHTGVDNVRQVIVETVALAPARDRFKVFIIDEAHMLSVPAFNALLKTIEEPPPHVIFILATTESTKIPATIASRCQRFRFRPIDDETMIKHLGALAKKEKISVEAEALELLAQSAGGSLRDAVGLLDQAHTFSDRKITTEQVREVFGFVPQEFLLGVAAAIFSRAASDLAEWLEKSYKEGVEPSQLVRDLRGALEPLYMEKLGVKAEPLEALRKAGESATAGDLGFLMRRFSKILEELRVSDSPRLTLELGLFSCLESAWDIKNLVARLEDMERRLQAGGEASMPEPSRAPASRPSAGSPVEESSSGLPAQSRGAGDFSWKGFVESFRDKPSLSAALMKCRYSKGEGGLVRLAFSSGYEMGVAERNNSLIEAKLSTELGEKIKIKLESGAQDDGDVVEDSQMAELSGGPPEGGTWKDVTEEDEGGQEPVSHPLKKAQKLLGGHVKIIRKK